jgi:hypothetical protein
MPNMDPTLDPITRLYRACDPLTPLEAGDTRYVPLAAARGEPKPELGGWRHELIKNIRNSERQATFLVSGFTGDGKSTELKRVEDELNRGTPKMAVVYVDTEQYLNLSEYSFNEVLLSVIAETGIQLRQKYEVELRPGYGLRKLTEMKTVLTSDVELKDLSAAASVDLFKLAAKVALRAKSQNVTRKELWDILAGDQVSLAEEFQRAVNEVGRPALAKKGYTNLVIILDKLEKLFCQPGKSPGTPNSHEALFLLNASLFQSFGAHVVLTVPIDMMYSAVEERLTAAYGRQGTVITAAKVADFFPEEVKTLARRMMRELLALRADFAGLKYAEMFPATDPDLANDLIAFSGGHPRQLLIIVQQCLTYLDGKLPITRVEFDAARKKEVQSASRKVADAWFPLLAAVHRTHRAGNDAEHLTMLRNLCVFAYSNNETVYGVDPAILELRKMKEAIAAYDKSHSHLAG